jgi:hypothetical protein
MLLGVVQVLILLIFNLYFLIHNSGDSIVSAKKINKIDILTEIQVVDSVVCIFFLIYYPANRK